MSERKDLKSPDRRKFFQKTALGFGAAGTVAIGLSSGPAKAESAADGRSRKGSYRETDHVRRFYDLARF